MAKKNNTLGNRMKAYENVSRNYLTRRIPVIIRLDGKGFHTFTRGMKKPFDNILMQTMQETMRYLCENIQGCVLGYTQSDEITLILTDYKTITTDPWLGYNIQKMSSISASMATLAFNKFFEENVSIYNESLFDAWNTTENDWKYSETLSDKVNKALFDSRVFSIPKEEVCSCLIWRQQDATRNSIQAVGQANFSQKQLQRKSCNMIQDMLFTEKGINWNNFSTDQKRGTCCYRIAKNTTITDPKDKSKFISVSRNVWTIDHEIPIFTQDRYFVERWL